MKKVKDLATRLSRSVERITNLPVLLIMRMFSAVGLSGAIARSARRAVRKDRLILASVILVSLEVAFFILVLVPLALGLAKVKSKLELTNMILRMVLIVATAGSMLFFKYKKVARKHELAAVRRAIARDRRNA